ncbi:prenyltransferase [bacterium]|nr:prenyltransferase [bacterium]
MNKWLLTARGPFLILPLVLTLYGMAVAYYLGNGSINWFYSILAGLGLVSLHISVNVFNEYFDFLSRIDFATPKTPFSGGSGVLPEGKMTARQALVYALVALIIGLATGLFLAAQTGWELLFIGLIGLFLVIFYTPVLAKIMLGELGAGLGLGFLPVLGIQFVNTGQLSGSAMIAAVPAGFLVFNLLLLNEFPDCEADAQGGRRHLVIIFGKPVAGWIYTAVALAVFLWIVLWVILGFMPTWTLIALMALPISLRACLGAIRDYDSCEKLLPAQGINVAVTMLTQILLALGYFITSFRI